MPLQRLDLKTVHPTTGYTHAIRTGDFLTISGQIALDKEGRLVGHGDIEAQVHQVFKNLQSILTEAGAGFDKLVKTGVFLTHPFYREAFRKIRAQYLGSHAPCSTVLVVASLAQPHFLVEVEAVAYLGK
ncbi:MAG: RidA family protein [Alphaproteobacteria bacterium]|nr:RidA family protein [Alphaproteobacteria bacterium]